MTDVVTDPQPRLSAAARSILIPIVLFGMYAAFGAAWLGARPLFPEIQAEFAVDLRSAAWLLNIVSMAKSVTPILAGIIAARIGLTSTMRMAALLMCVALLVPWLPTFPLWVVGRFLFGIGGAIWVALMGAVVVEAVAKEGRAFVNAMNGVAVNTGAVVGLKYALPLNVLGFRMTMTILAGALVVFAVLLVAVGPLSQTKPAKVPMSTLLAAYKSVLLEKTTWIVAFAFTGPLALYLILSSYLPTHMEQAFKMPRIEALGWLIHTMIWAIPGSLLVGVLLQKKMGSARLHMVVGAILTVLATWMALQATDDDSRKVWFALVGVGVFWPVAPLVTSLQQLPKMTTARVGMVMGTMASVSYVISAFAPDIVGKAVADGHPAAAAMLPCCLFGLTPIIALLLPTTSEP